MTGQAGPAGEGKAWADRIVCPTKGAGCPTDGGEPTPRTVDAGLLIRERDLPHWQAGGSY